MHGTSALHTSTTDPGNSTYPQQMDTAHLPKRPITPRKIKATTLTCEIQKIRKENQTSQGRHGEALQKLAKVFSDIVDQVPSTPTHTN